MRAAALWLLLGLFALRVAGQLAVALSLAPFLPPMDEWYSGLLPYGPLLASQILIIAVFTKVCADMSRETGYFAHRRRWLGTPLHVFGWVYAATMVVRYVVTMTIHPDRRWTGRGTIPIAFHLVLAAFLLVLADYHRRAAANGRHH
jgi:uncharacterized protein